MHQAHAAHVADERVLFLELVELLTEVAAHAVGVFQEPFLFDHLDRGARRDGRHRVAAERGNRHALESIGDFRRGDGQAHGHTVGHAFGAGDDVGLDFPVLDAEPLLAGASEARLDFVRDEQAPVLLDDVEHDLKVFLGRGDETARALDRLGEKGGDRARGGRPDHLLHVIRALDTAAGISHPQGTPVAVGADGVRHAHADDAALAPRGHGRE